MNDSNDLDAGAALAEIDRSSRRVRAGARRDAWYWLAFGLGTVAFYALNYLVVSPSAAADPVPPVYRDPGLLLPAGWLLFALLLTLFAARQRVVDREQRQLATPLLLASVALGAVAVLVGSLLVPDRLSGWASLVGLLPALPLFYGAWRALRR